MIWDYVESNIFSNSSGNFLGQIAWVSKVIGNAPTTGPSEVKQVNASSREYSRLVISTDPPYYDNIGYSDLSDFFYVWLRRSLGDIHSSTVATMLSPKAEELVANPYRHNRKTGCGTVFCRRFQFSISPHSSRWCRYGSSDDYILRL